MSHGSCWDVVLGSLDGGIGRTIGSLALHEKYCIVVHNRREHAEIILGDESTTYKVKKAGYVFVRVQVEKFDPIHLGEVQILLIDKDCKSLYINGMFLLSTELYPKTRCLN